MNRRLILNREEVATDLPAGHTLLEFIRHERQLTGTKEGCQGGDCGACQVLLGHWDGTALSYQPINSCLLPLGEAAGRHVVTIEGLNDGAVLNPVQQLLVDQGAVQCGFCTPGLVIALTAFLLNGRPLDDREGILAVGGNLCRCTGYVAIKRVVHALAGQFRDLAANAERRFEELIYRRVLPAYFRQMPARLQALPDLPPAALRLSPAAVWVAGGTDLYGQIPAPLPEAKLAFLLRRTDLKGIRCEGQRCVIGAATTVEEMRQSSLLADLIPPLSGCLELFCSAPVRQRATVGGNIVNASPSGDLTVLLLGLNATVGLYDGRRRREVALKDFFKGYKQLAKTAEEWLEWVSFEPPPKGGFHFEKTAKRPYLDIASVNSAMTIQVQGNRIEQIHLAAGGVAPIPLYLTATVDYLRGRPLTAAHVRAAAAIAQTEIAPISDVRGSADYKRLLLRQLIFAHFLSLYPHRITWEALL